MEYAPDPPYPKEEGDAIRSNDWNELVEEVQRLEAAKLGGTGGAVRGDLIVEGSVGVGTQEPQDRLDLHGALCFDSDTNRRVYGASRAGRDTVVVDAQYDELEIKGRVLDWTGGDFFVGLDNPHASSSVHIGRRCAAVALYSGGGTSRTVTVASGRVGIGTSSPARQLHVVGDAIRLQKSGSSHHLNMSMHGNAIDLFCSGADLYVNNTSEGRKTRVRNLVNVCSRDYKTEIGSLGSEDADDLLDALCPVRFRDRGAEEERRLGFVAEDTPEGVATEDGKGVDQMAITAILTRVVKQQRDLIVALQKEVSALKAEIRVPLSDG